MIKKKTYCSLTAQIFFNLQNRPSFHSEERLVNLERGRECIVGLSILLVYVHSVYSTYTEPHPPSNPNAWEHAIPWCHHSYWIVESENQQLNWKRLKLPVPV